MNHGRIIIYIVASVGLTACGGTTPVEDPTIGTLVKQSGATTKGKASLKALGVDRTDVIARYRQFLRDGNDAELKARAMRRLADLEMDANEDRLAGEVTSKARSGKAGSVRSYRSTIALYKRLLRTYPNYSGNDRVLYQLAKAYEHAGEPEQAMKVMDRLVRQYPGSEHRIDVQFRRGEYLFERKKFGDAQQAYADVLKAGNQHPLYEKALYKHGWSQFKRVRYAKALDSFTELLGRTLVDPASPTGMRNDSTLSRGQRELVKDTLRAVTLSFSYLGGAKPLEQYYTRKGGQPYVPQLYDRLGALYTQQERYTDAADVYRAYVARYPFASDAPRKQEQIIAAYQTGGLSKLVLSAKEEFVNRYRPDAAYWGKHPRDAYPDLDHKLNKHINELATHYHAMAQSSGRRDDYRASAEWYKLFLATQPKSQQSAGVNFLYAESLYEAGDRERAAVEYERAAYNYPQHARSADAGYSAILAWRDLARKADAGTKPYFDNKGIDSSLKFADRFTQDKRRVAVLTKVAEVQFARNQFALARDTAGRVLATKQPISPAHRQTVLTVLAHAEFDLRHYAAAEKAYGRILRMGVKGKSRQQLVERLAASVYKQGETARLSGDIPGSVRHFQRVARVAPGATIRAAADYDAATGMIELSRWQAAARQLEAFRRDHPGHELQKDVDKKLSIAYLELKQWGKAAHEFERLADANPRNAVGQEALRRAAELRDKAGQHKQAMKLYAAYIKRFPGDFEQGIEMRYRLAEIDTRRRYWLQSVIDTETRAGTHSNNRARFLAAKSALELAEPKMAAFNKTRLRIPLKKSLKLKKKQMEAALAAYDKAAKYGIAEVTTASTFQIAEIYHGFSKDLIKSQRPRGLSADELEQYEVLLEEQAYPFEEKAIQVHEANSKRMTAGLYDSWIQQSMKKLEKLKPVQYSKPERSRRYISAIH